MPSAGCLRWLDASGRETHDLGRRGERGDEERGLDPGLAVDVASTVDHHDALQSGPSIVTAPCGSMEHGRGPGFRSAVVAIHHRSAAYDHIPDHPKALPFGFTRLTAQTGIHRKSIQALVAELVDALVSGTSG